MMKINWKLLSNLCKKPTYAWIQEGKWWLTRAALKQFHCTTGILDDSSTSQSKIKWKEILPNKGLFNSESIIQQYLEYCARQ